MNAAPFLPPLSLAITRPSVSPYALRAAAVVVVASLVRAAFGAHLGLTDTEAYYAAWARFPSLGYYDHSPMIAWLIRATTVFGANAATTRLGPLLCGALFSLLLYRFTRRIFTPRAGFIAVILATALPVLTATGFIANPEAPLLPMWLLVLQATWDLRMSDAWWRPLALGAAVGAAFLCKFTGLLAAPVALLVIASSPRARRWFRRPSLYAGVLVALAVASPVLWWNHLHGWPSLRLHLVERMPDAPWTSYARNALRLGVGQAAHFHPLIWPGLLAAMPLTVSRGIKDERYRMLAVASLPVLAFFFAVMIRACDAEPHWTMVGYLPLVVAAAAWLDERIDGAAPLLRAYLVACLGVSLGFIALCALHVRSTVLLRALPTRIVTPDLDPVNETLGWDALRAAVTAEVTRLGPNVVLASHHNVLCGHILVATRDAPRLYCASPTRTAFDFFGRGEVPPSVATLYIESARYPSDPATRLAHHHCRALRRV